MTNQHTDFFSRFEGLTFDDVVIVPGYSDVLPDMVDTSTIFARDIELSVPLVSAAMDKVTEAGLAIALARIGGLDRPFHVLRCQQRDINRVDQIAGQQFFIGSKSMGYGKPLGGGVGTALIARGDGGDDAVIRIQESRNDMFTADYGFIVDYLAEILKDLRREDYTNEYKRFFDLSSTITTRDKDSISKTFAGLFKVIYPNGVVTKDEAKELLEFAIESRKRVKFQLQKCSLK